MNSPEHKFLGNLSVDERSALKDHKSNFKLVIREADKRCSVVVMDRQRYIEEGYANLMIPQYIKRLMPLPSTK